MAKEDVSLPVEMGKLEIEPAKFNKTVTDENPFDHFSLQRRRYYTRNITQTLKCSCYPRRYRNVTICKKRHNKILKEPVLQLLQNFVKNNNAEEQCQHTFTNNNFLHCSSLQNGNSDNLNLCALVDNCNQLRISSGSNENDNSLKDTETSKNTKWWKKDVLSEKQCKERTSDKGRAGPSCSQQALNPPCDVTIDELASYFETLVHIPKKMSSMAEMMYI